MPVETPLGYGMLVYVRDGGSFANDVFAIGAEFDGKVVWWTSAAWDDEYNSFYNFVHSNHNLVDINDPRFVGWRPMQQPF